jgi:hypothetical protein
VRVSLATSGGFAAALRLGHPPVVVDGADLPAADVDRLTALLAAVRQEDAPADDRRARDAVTATLTVDDAGTTTVLRRSETASTRAWEELLAWVREHAGP